MQPQSRQKVDPEDFLAWKEHPVTRWVLDRLQHQAAEREANQRELLYRAPARTSPQEWASLQPNAAFVQGQNDLVDFLVELRLEDLLDEPEATD